MTPEQDFGRLLITIGKSLQKPDIGYVGFRRQCSKPVNVPQNACQRKVGHEYDPRYHLF
jgi:hypothetical protein